VLPPNLEAGDIDSHELNDRVSHLIFLGLQKKDSSSEDSGSEEEDAGDSDVCALSCESGGTVVITAVLVFRITLCSELTNLFAYDSRWY
jgi:hypothetical protein